VGLVGFIGKKDFSEFVVFPLSVSFRKCFTNHLHLNTAIIRRKSCRSLGTLKKVVLFETSNEKCKEKHFDILVFRPLITLRQLRNCPATTVYGLDDRGSYLCMRKLCSQFRHAWRSSATHAFVYWQQFSLT
jgi:hypothetical protein